jgi:hypothetical protein
MQFGVLGPLQVTVAESDQLGTVSAPQLRALLAALLWRANQPVPTDELAELVWDGALPAAPGLDPWDAHAAAVADTAICPLLTCLRSVRAAIPTAWPGSRSGGSCRRAWSGRWPSQCRTGRTRPGRCGDAVRRGSVRDPGTRGVACLRSAPRMSSPASTVPRHTVNSPKFRMITIHGWNPRST